jgi:hypothetical protein
MDSNQGENWGLLGHGVVAGFLSLVSYYVMTYGIEYSMNNDRWRAVFAIFGGLSIIVLVVSVFMTFNGKTARSKRLLQLGTVLLVALVMLLIFRTALWAPLSYG